MNTKKNKFTFLLSIAFILLAFNSIEQKSNDKNTKHNYQLYSSVINDKVMTNYNSAKCKDCHKDGIIAINLIKLSKNKCGYKLDLFIQ